MKQALNDWVALQEERHRLTLEALADVDAGNVVDHQLIWDWVRGLGTSEDEAQSR